MVAKPINSTSAQKVNKSFKKYPLTPLEIVNLLLRHKQSSMLFLKNVISPVKKLCVAI